MKNKEEMFQNTNYIDWLIQFTEKNPVFSDKDWIYNPGEITQEDYEKVKALPAFFNGIDSFASRNYLASNNNEWGENYFIRKDDAYMNIGYTMGEEINFYCERVEKGKGSINFYSIINENLPMRTMFIDRKLEGISDELKELMVTLKVPVNFIEEMIDRTGKEIEKEKKLIKK